MSKLSEDYWKKVNLRHVTYVYVLAHETTQHRLSQMVDIQSSARRVPNREQAEMACEDYDWGAESIDHTWPWDRGDHIVKMLLEEAQML